MNRVSAPGAPSIDCLSVLVQTRSITASNLARSRPPISLDPGFQVYLQTRSITASKCISKLARSRPPSASPNSLDPGLQVYFQTRSISNSLDHCLQVHLQTRSIPVSKCISKLARLLPPSASTHSLDHGLQVHLQTRSIMASECISEFTRSSFSGAPRIALKLLLQPVQIYRV
jgi:hypothetical protein